MKIISLLYNEDAHWRNAYPEALFNVISLPEHLSFIEKGDVVIFHGGSDINPELYGETPDAHTGYPDNRRDSFEVAAFNKAKSVGAFCFGICRGAQLLTVLHGGKLKQHIEGHNGTMHTLKTKDGSVIRANSCHHQQCVPNEEGIVLADLDGVPELLYFPKTKSFGVQGHPEWLSFDSSLTQFCQTFCKGLWKC